MDSEKNLHLAVPCYFSRISELRDSLEMDYPKLKTSKHYTEEAESQSNPSSKLTRSNACVRLAKDGRTLEFTTNGGMILEVNTGIKITNIFPL